MFKRKLCLIFVIFSLLNLTQLNAVNPPSVAEHLAVIISNNQPQVRVANGRWAYIKQFVYDNGHYLPVIGASVALTAQLGTIGYMILYK